MKSLHLPGPTGRQAIGLAALSWFGAPGGWFFGWPALVLSGVVGVAMILGRRWFAAALLVAASFSGWAAAARVQYTLGTDIVEGPVMLLGEVADEPLWQGDGYRFVFKPRLNVLAGV